MDIAKGRDDWRDATQIGREVDEACDRFEAAWRAGRRPRIEDFLGEATDPGSSVRLRHLLAVELDYRRGLDEAPGSSEYHRRFPGPEGLIDAAFARLDERTRPGAAEDPEISALSTGRDGVGPPDGEGPAAGPFPNIPGCEILSELGRGGMGVVYKARQIRLNRLCALKIALSGRQAGPEARARFLAEAETIARFAHPNVVQIYGLGEHDGLVYFEMEYIEGGSLARRLDGTPWAPGPAAPKRAHPEALAPQAAEQLTDT